LLFGEAPDFNAEEVVGVSLLAEAISHPMLAATSVATCANPAFGALA